MMFPISYLVYSENYFTCSFTNNSKDQSEWRIIHHSRQGFITTLALGVCPGVQV